VDQFFSVVSKAIPKMSSSIYFCLEQMLPRACQQCSSADVEVVEEVDLHAWLDDVEPIAFLSCAQQFILERYGDTVYLQYKYNMSDTLMYGGYDIPVLSMMYLLQSQVYWLLSG